MTPDTSATQGVPLDRQTAVLAHPAAGLGRERAAEVLAALRERGVGCMVLGNGTLGHEQFDAVVEIAPDGIWTRTGRQDQPV